MSRKVPKVTTTSTLETTSNEQGGDGGYAGWANALRRSEFLSALCLACLILFHTLGLASFLGFLFLYYVQFCALSFDNNMYLGHVLLPP